MPAVRTMIFDVDGTLYGQRRLRCYMLERLALACIRNPNQGLLAWKVVRAYRRAQEHLRRCEPIQTGLPEAQIELAARWTGVEPAGISAIIERWMEQNPMDLLSGCVRQGLIPLLEKARKRGIALGVFSDYPAVRKLAAMRLETYFDVVVSAQDPEVQRFKPDPKGLELTLARLGGERRTALYVGDRPDVDGAAAHRAGMRCVIVGGRYRGAQPGRWIAVRGFTELAAAL